MATEVDWGDLLARASKTGGRDGLPNPSLVSQLLVAKENNDVGAIGKLLSNNAYNSKAYGGSGDASSGLFMSNKNYIDPGDYADLIMPKKNTGPTDWDKYSAPGFADTLFNDKPTTDIGAILSQQANKYRQELDAGRQRGMYSPDAYNAGLAELNKQYSTAMPMAQDMVSGLYKEGVGDRRTQIEDILVQAKDAKGKDGLPHEQFDFSPWKTQIDNVIGGYQAPSEDKILSALNGSSFFTMPDVRNAIAGSQGATNSNNPAMLQALMEQRQRQGTTRGLGNQGGL